MWPRAFSQSAMPKLDVRATSKGTWMALLMASVRSPALASGCLEEAMNSRKAVTSSSARRDRVWYVWRVSARSSAIRSRSPAKSLWFRVTCRTFDNNASASVALTAATVTPAGTGSRLAMRSRKASSVEVQIESDIYLRESDNSSRGRVYIDIVVPRSRGQSGHGGHRSEQRIEKARANTGANVPHRHRKSARRPLQIRIVAQAILRLRHADGQLIKTLPRV